MRLTEATALSKDFVERVRPAMDAVTNHDYFRRASDSSLTLAQARKALLGFYPLVEAFPRYMGLTLAKMESGDHERDHDRARAGEARRWISTNVRTEARHARWWVDWGRGFGIAADEFSHARATADMDAPNRYLQQVASTGSVAEAVAAVNYALEGATGIWTRATLPALSHLGERYGYRATGRSLRWLRAHARYDDRHPVEALEVVKVYATDEAAVAKAASAAIRSLDYLAAALEDALAA